MKKISMYYFVSLGMSAMLLLPTVASASTLTQNETNKPNRSSVTIQNVPNMDSTYLTIYDNYVDVENNKFTLKESAYSDLNENILNKINNQITISNNIVNEAKLTIDKNTKTATFIENNDNLNPISDGHNGFEVHWNYWRVYVSKQTVNSVISAGAAGGGVILGGFLDFAGGEAVGAAIAEFIVSQWGHVDNGIFFDVNFLFGINNWGWQ
ncbi:hypothetical protein [Weissella koreensis]|uniref:hypothetical protein n=1 Tax=Weissella koreensis TaxID=165096 RepID=UPI000CF31983|nr:hypothetical protein [Weissella koreensis]AVH75873.1 hypothetical protein C4597_07530 [Weissella koreensis]